MDVPDWLSESATEGEASAVSADAQEDDIRPADLPDWVQAMRPVESVITGTEGQPVEEQVTVWSLLLHTIEEDALVIDHDQGAEFFLTRTQQRQDSEVD